MYSTPQDEETKGQFADASNPSDWPIVGLPELNDDQSDHDNASDVFLDDWSVNISIAVQPQEQQYDSDSEWNYFGDENILHANEYDSESESPEEEAKSVNIREIEFVMEDSFASPADYLERLIDMMKLEHRDFKGERLGRIEQTVTKFSQENMNSGWRQVKQTFY